MFWNYLIIGLRNLIKQKLLSIINIASLALGVASCLLIFLFIQDETSFDAFHDKKDRLYRLDEVQSFPGTNTQNVALSMPGMAPALKRDYSEIVDVTRFWGRGKRLFRHNDNRLLVEKTATVDSNFLELFDYQILEGDRTRALDEPFAIVLTESIAKSFFGSQNAMGQTLQFDTFEYQVTGIIEDVPENSHLQFDLLMSMATIISDNPQFNEQFGSNFLNTYVLFDNNVNISDFESKMPDFLSRCMPPDEDDQRDVNDYYKLFYQPLADVHLGSMDIEHDYNNYRKFNGAYLDIFKIVGLFILLIACINFMNLITARAARRGKEIGVRKTIGAFKSQLFGQFLTESFILTFVAFFLGIGLAFIFSPLLNQLMDRQLSMLYFVRHPLILVGSFGFVLILGLLASIYPSSYMASFDPIRAIQGSQVGRRKSMFQNALVILQFGLAIAMIICTIVVVKQLFFMQNRDLGFNKDHIVLVDMNGEANQVFETLKTELKANSTVLGVTASGQRLGNNFHQWGFKLQTDSIRGLTPSNVNVDYDYLDVYEIELLKGRGFDKERARDKDYAFVINESFAKEIGIEDPIGVNAGHSWYEDDSLGTIIGVAKDFNFNSLHYDINTLAMVVHPDWGYDELSVKINSRNIESAIQHIKSTWNRLVPSWPFQYSFLDEHFEELYTSERHMKSIVTIMAFLAILIACMGLFGLAAIHVEQRTKEIGLRKVLGATISQIMAHLSKHFVILVVIAFLIFSPLTWFFMSNWLNSYAERISMSPIIYLIGFLIALGIAFSTISVHTLRSALANPVDSLRDD